MWGRLRTLGSAAAPAMAGLVVVSAAAAAADHRSLPDDKAAVERRLLEQAAENVERHRKGEARIELADGAGRPIAGSRLEVRLVRHEFLFGCILFDLVGQREPAHADAYRRRFVDLFHFGVLPFYWKRYEPTPGATMEAPVRAVAEWARRQGVTLKGHPLAWTHPAGVPDWVARLPVEQRQARLRERIEREVRAFAGLIDIWDVVNEAVHTRTWDHVGVRDYIAEPIERVADYVEPAFRAARRANPEAHLILNEFGVIADRNARERFRRLAAELKRRGAPVDALGVQAHEPREHWYPPLETWATFDRLASLGLPLHVTEFIPQSGGKPITGGWRTGRWTEQAQADFAEQFFRLSFGHPAVRSINWWGLSDRRIWLPGGGLVDADFQPKPVYRRLHRLIHEEWTTRASLTTDDQGRTSLRGFYGTYEIAAFLPDGSRATFQAQLRRGQANQWRLRAEPKQSVSVRAGRSAVGGRVVMTAADGAIWDLGGRSDWFPRERAAEKRRAPA